MIRHPVRIGALCVGLLAMLTTSVTADSTPTAHPAAAPSAPLPYTTSNHTIDAGDGVTLEARLFSPTSAPAPWPTIITVSGSGPDESLQDPYTRLLLDVWCRAGIAVLTFNKRGVGHSSGTATESDFDQRASDVLAVARYARGMPGVDAHGLGLWGISQAGWVLPKAVAIDSNFAFLVMVSPPGVSPARQVQFYLEGEFRGLGLSPKQASDAALLFDRIGRYYASGIGADSVQRAITAVAAQPWYVKAEKHPFWHDMAAPGRVFTPSELPAAIQAKPADFAWTSAPSTYADYAADYRSIRVPTLIIYGGRDALVPIALSQAEYDHAFRASGYSDVRFHTFPNGDHDIQISIRAVETGYREMIRDFVLAHAPRR